MVEIGAEKGKKQKNGNFFLLKHNENGQVQDFRTFEMAPNPAIEIEGGERERERVEDSPFKLVLGALHQKNRKKKKKNPKKNR